MPRSFLDTFVADPIPAHKVLHDRVLASLPSSPSSSQPLVPVANSPPVQLAGFPFKSVYDLNTGKVVGDINLSPHVDTEENPDATPEDVRAVCRYSLLIFSLRCSSCHRGNRRGCWGTP